MVKILMESENTEEKAGLLVRKEVGYGERLGDKLFSDMLNYT